MGSHIFLQGIFLTQGSNPGVLYCRQILFHLSHQGSSNYISVVTYMVAKFNKKHFIYWFNMFFNFCVYLPWKLLLCWFQTEVLNGYKFDLSGSYCMLCSWKSISQFDLMDLIIYIWNSPSRVHLHHLGLLWVSQVVLMVKNPPGNVGDSGDMGLIPGSGRSPEGGNDNPHQYYLENPMDSGGWRATVHGVAKSWTWLKWLSTHGVYFCSLWTCL